ncbi:adenylate/guanylate cyclase domain-containing protein [Mycobacterium sp. DL592]|uniref:ATP-binding protein n=1 Tax=Mycobacterium sp. DL592 TaxID=2675524 RepID=UPI001421E0F2|nr:adenylate/guanylate cyclase domain-containing protein [Mycobacterium sp. DL592]
MTDGSPTARIDELLDQACQAINAGDRAKANVIAEQILEFERGNAEAEDLLAAPAEAGEIRRLTIMFADLVDSTELSTRIEPEVYRTVVGRYREEVLRMVGQYGGHVGSTKGDGLLAFFGHPYAHEDDIVRAVQAGLEITSGVVALSNRVRRQFGFPIAVRVGIHRGIVYLDTEQDDVYGLAANLAARICSIAEPNSVAVSEAVEPLIRDHFELQARLPRSVKGVSDPVTYFRVLAERDVRPAPLGPLVGREEEVTYLREAWSQARRNELQTPGVVFLGEAGIGKSRLAWSAVGLAERSHGAVIELIGSPLHQDVGLRPIRRLLERRCRITRASSAAQRLENLRTEVDKVGLDPETFVPLLAPVLGIAPEGGYQTVQAEGRKLFQMIVDAVVAYLAACVRDAPALVLAEDMHWFDEDTAEVAQALLASNLGGHVLVVMTSRTPVAIPAPELATLFPLKPLSGEQSDLLITTLHPEVSEADRAAVRLRSDGIPLFIEELVTKLRNVPNSPSPAASVPDTLYEALFARLQTGAGSGRVVETAALIGNRVERSLLLSAVDLSEEELDEVLGQLVESRVLEPLSADSWRFRHELLREVATELPPPTLRRKLHGRVADSLVATAASGNPDWPLIAHHYAGANRHADSAGAYGRAAENAWQRGALNEARIHLTSALAEATSHPAGAIRDQMEIAIRLRRALLAQAAEGASSANAAADFESCLQLCSDDLQDDDVFSTVMSLYPYYTMRADLDRADLLVNSVRASLTGSRRKFLPINEFALGMLAWYRGDFGQTRAKLEVAIATLTEEAIRELESKLFMPNDATAGLFTQVAMMGYIDGNLPAAETGLAKAEAHCATLPFPQGAFSLAYTRQNEVLIRIEAGQLDRAGEVALELAALGERHGFDSWALVGMAQHASVTAFQALAEHGDDPAALAPHVATISAYVEAWRQLGVIALLTFYDALLARLLTASGDRERARERIDVALALARETGMHFYDAELLRIRAAASDDVDTRRTDLDAALSLAHSQDARLFGLRCAVDLFDLDATAGATALAEALAQLPADCGWPEVERARTLVE